MCSLCSDAVFCQGWVVFVLLCVCLCLGGFLIRLGTDHQERSGVCAHIPLVGAWNFNPKAVGHTYGHLERELTTLFPECLVYVLLLGQE